MSEMASVATGDDPAVVAEGLTKSFDGVGRVLSGFDLTVPRGETTVLLGPNGCGKTVALSCLTGGLHPSAGAVRLFGEPPQVAADRFVFLLQNSMAVRELSGREVIDFFCDLHPHATDGWREIVDRLELREALDRRVRDYSGGMVRKLEIAVTLSVDVPLYVLDEPTAALDMTTVGEVHALLDERTDDGRTVLLSSHAPADVAVADRVAFVRSGRVPDAGDPERLLADVPRVVTVEGRPDEVTDYVRDGRFFEGDGVYRGFLRADVDPTAVGSAGGAGTSVRVTDPRVGDLFNYYVHLVDGAD